MTLTTEQEQWMAVHQSEALSLYKGDRLNSEQKACIERLLPGLMREQELEDFLFSRGWTWKSTYYTGDLNWIKPGMANRVSLKRAIAIENRCRR